MKKLTKFLSVFAIVAIFLPVIACSNDDEPSYDPTQDPSYNDTVIYIIDVDSVALNYIVGSVAFLEIEESCFDGYRVVVKHIMTFDTVANEYKIYIPSEGANIRLKDKKKYWWISAGGRLCLDGQLVDWTKEVFEYYGKEEYKSGWGERYYYRLHNEYMEFLHDEKYEFNIKIGPNDTKEERVYQIYVSTGNSAPRYWAYFYFIQEGKK